MAIRLQLTPADVKARKVLTPGPYGWEIRAVYTKPSKEDKSINYVFELVGIDGEAKDVLIRKYFNEKFIAPIVPLLQALGQQVSEEDVTSVDLEAAQGMKVRGIVETRMYQNTPQNDIVAWAPYEQAA